MLKKIIHLLTIVPLLSHSQIAIGSNQVEIKGIEFIKGISWQQVIEKAKSEGKSIFVDCYTTWCVPCKKMERDVFSDELVGDFFNKNFICYKLQIDSTKNDNDQIKATYRDAGFFKNKYDIYTFPTALFFSSDGKLLTKKEGLITSAEFLRFGKDVLDPNKNYYNLLNGYKQGRRDLNEMSILARSALMLQKDTVTAVEVAKEYLSRLKPKEYLEKSNLEFMQIFTKTSKDVGFNIYYRYADTIGKIMEARFYAKSVVRSIIFTEMALPLVQQARKTGNEPNWLQISSRIKNKYNGFYADYVIAALKVDWYKMKKNWKEYSKAVINWVESYDLTSNEKSHWSALELNNSAWEIFKYSDDKNDLRKAIKWSGQVVLNDPNPNWMDTYANLLYKIGEPEMAIRWETIANQLEPNVDDYKINLEKMKKGQKTWEE